MKDHSLSWKTGPIYKEVVIIGNGPSGLALSYILSGRWPYYNGQPHPDPMLTLRLQSLSRSHSLLEQDLAFLSQGIEGRGSSAVGSLLDAMLHPGADQGLDLDPLIEWRCHKRIDHVVIGKGPPGGAWQAMDSNILTLSLSSWMELPGMRFEEWEKEAYSNSKGNRRVRVSKVAKYYQDYVHKQRLARYQRRGLATSVTRYDEVINDFSDKKINWKIEVEDSFGRKLCYYSRCVVLATGTNDCPNRLGISGENLSWVHHDLKELEKELVENKEKEPMLVVGAGLSASDAVLACRRSGCHVYHVFRRPNVAVDKMLPPSMYPEYHKVQEMMLNHHETFPGYTAFPGYTLQEMTEEYNPEKRKLVKIESISGDSAVLEVCSAAILIGSRPNLDFFKHKGIGVFEGEIDSRSNPIDIDPFTYELRSQPFMYALGPITGDNLVRYILGGVTAVAAHLNTSLNS
ncbi:oxidative stress-induced growth inhibitor 2-like isoform X2 [Rhodnius prolixus]|uniref:oxidative stress-induced growth inhibitor 2-like isoform X2 n=1 Tax=Rhodnius prolixus TaxID=13249 RepID=UPI003D18ED7B